MFAPGTVQSSSVLLLLASAACAAVHPVPTKLSPEFVAATGTPHARNDANVITRAEIMRGEMPSAYDVILYARRQWVRGRGVMTLGEWRADAPIVYLENVRYGTCETLKDIRSDDVAEMRFVDAQDATTRFGTGHTAGVILVTLRR